METANGILNFDFSPAALQQAAKSAFPANTIHLYELRIDKLKKITEEVGETSFKFTGETLIPQVFKKFKLIVSNGGVAFNTFERRELRTLTIHFHIRNIISNRYLVMLMNLILFLKHYKKIGKILF